MFSFVLQDKLEFERDLKFICYVNLIQIANQLFSCLLAVGRYPKVIYGYLVTIQGILQIQEYMALFHMVLSGDVLASR